MVNAERFIDQTVGEIQREVGTHKVVIALSGGVDSSVCAALAARAIGDHLTPIYVDTGLMRKGETDRLYLSHLPMFMSMHDRQVILEVTLESDMGDAHAIYRTDRRETGERLYTLVPERFSLQRLGAEVTEALRSFSWRRPPGSLRKAGQQSHPEDATVRVVNVIHSRQFDPQATMPTRSNTCSSAIPASFTWRTGSPGLPISTSSFR